MGMEFGIGLCSEYKLQVWWYVILTCRKWIQNNLCCELMDLDSEETNKLLGHVLINFSKHKL